MNIYHKHKEVFKDFLNWTLMQTQPVSALATETLENGTLVDVIDAGVIQFTPPNPKALDLVISCGIHGNETAPIEITCDIIQQLLAGKIQTQARVLFIIGNPAAIHQGTRFVEENMNRLFSGTHSEGPGCINPERERAKKLEGYVQDFFEARKHLTLVPRERLHYDLHTAIRDSKHEKFVIYPYQNGRSYSKLELQRLLAMGVSTVLLHDRPATTFSYFSVTRCQAQAFTVELGKVRPFGQNDLSRFAQTKHMLIELLSDTLVLEPFNQDKYKIYQVSRNILRTEENFVLNFPDEQANFSTYEKGFLLAKDGQQPYFVEAEQEAIVFPNAQVALGQRALLTVVPIEANELEISD